jgi:hypothetical protein
MNLVFCPCGALIIAPTPDEALDECRKDERSPLDPKLAAAFIRTLLPRRDSRLDWRPSHRPQPLPLGATALEAMKLEHVKQSVNGCVTCSRKWSDHTDVERG